MIVFTASRLNDSFSKIKVRHDYASNIVTADISMVDDVMNDITDDKAFDGTVSLCCNLLQEKRNQGTLWYEA